MKKQLHQFLILIYLMAFSNVVFAGAVTCTYSRIEASEPIVFKRQFARTESQPITITIDEIKEAYKPGKKIIFNEAQLGSPQNINIGVDDKNNAQNWSISNVSFTTIDTMYVENMSTTGFDLNFPDSDFALRRKNKGCTNCDEFEFGNFQNDGIYYDGQVDYDRSSNKRSVDTLDYIISELPISMDNITIINDTIEEDDETIYLKGNEKYVGYGTLTATDGSIHEVLKSVFVFSEKKNNTTTYEKVINFVSDDGYRLALILSDTSQKSGQVNVKHIQEFIFKSTTTTSLESKNLDKKSFIWYPNPVKDRLYTKENFNENISIYNIVGVKVKEFSNVNVIDSSIDVSDLPSGIYHLVSGNQSFRFIKESGN